MKKLSFAAFLKEERRKRGWTQAQLAEQLQVSTVTIGRWENNAPRRFWAYHRPQICTVLNITPEYLESMVDTRSTVYLLYAQADENFVQLLRKDLEKTNLRIGNDEASKKSAAEWNNFLQEMMAIIVVVSPRTLQDLRVLRELELAEKFVRPVLAWWVDGKRWKEVLPSRQRVLQCLDAIDARKDRYKQALDELIERLELLETGTPVDQQSTDGLRNPYKGLLAFSVKDAPDFFGRDQFIEMLIDQLETMILPSEQETEIVRLLPVVGPSGAGKSSIVFAGLLPRLQSNIKELPESSKWIYLQMKPGSNPIEVLSTTFGNVLPEKTSADIQAILSHRDGLHTLAVHLTKDCETRIVLVIDQFEEIFTQTKDEQVRTCFINLLINAVNASGGPLLAILTMRTDAYDHLFSYSELGQIIARQQQLLLPMEMNELEAAIKKPVTRFGLQLDFEGNLVRDLLFAVQGQSGALPFLQFTLTHLFEQRKEGLITYESYVALGGVKGALSRQAEAVYMNLSSDEQKLAQALFLRLIDPGKAEHNVTRRRIVRSELFLPDAKKTQLLEKVTQVFINAHLLTTDEHNGITTIEVSHDALISGWDRLANWIKKERSNIHIHQSLLHAIEGWERDGRPSYLLFRGKQLKNARTWAKDNIPNHSEETFLSASQKSIQRKRIFNWSLSIFMVVLILSSILSYLANQLSADPTIVTSTSDNGIGSLRAAIQAAGDGGTVRFDAHLKGTIPLTSGDLNINKNIVLRGTNQNQVAISSPNGHKVRIIQGISVSFENLTFKGSKTRDTAFIDNEGILIINKCIISDNVSAYNGGGVTNRGSLNLIDSTVVGNIASGNGAGVYSWNGDLNIVHSIIKDNISHNNGGGVYSLRSKFSLSDSVISDNRATNGSGGGINLVNAQLDLKNSIVTGNHSSAYGGGIAILGSQGIMNASLVRTNSADLQGGGIFVAKDSENNVGSAVQMTKIEITNPPKTDYYIGQNTDGNGTSDQYANIVGSITPTGNSIRIVDDDSGIVIGSPAPLNPPEHSELYLGVTDVDLFCQAKSFSRAILSNTTSVNQIKCLSRTEDNTRMFTLQEACQWGFPNFASDIIDRLADYYDPSSVQCYRGEITLGSIATEETLNLYCQYIKHVAIIKNGETAYDWKCKSSSGILEGFSVTDVCQWFYHRSDAFDRLVDFSHLNGWQCLAPREKS
jgi:transcriptional regulator with XRE-family HTH domain